MDSGIDLKKMDDCLFQNVKEARAILLIESIILIDSCPFLHFKKSIYFYIFYF